MLANALPSALATLSLTVTLSSSAMELLMKGCSFERAGLQNLDDLSKLEEFRWLVVLLF